MDVLLFHFYIISSILAFNFFSQLSKPPLHKSFLLYRQIHASFLPYASSLYILFSTYQT